MAVYGIITKNVYDAGRGTKWAIVPYYSDAAVYDESMPEFMDREISTADVDEAIEAVRAWLARVKHIRPENIPVHESSTKYADRFNREELVEYFVEALKGNRGDAQALKDMFGKMNTYWTQEEIDSAVDEAYVKYHEWFLEQARVREEFDRQMAEREAENPPESEVEIR